MNINEFVKEHSLALDYLLDDTWLCEEDIPVEEVEAWWHWMNRIEVETIPSDKFEETFGVTFKDIADYWNTNVLKTTKANYCDECPLVNEDCHGFLCE